VDATALVEHTDIQDGSTADYLALRQSLVRNPNPQEENRLLEDLAAHYRALAHDYIRESPDTTALPLTLWDIPVKRSTEEQVVSILRERLDSDTMPRIFTHPSITGHVYAQCSDVRQLKKALVNLTDVLHNSSPTAVPSEEAEPLLDPSQRFSTGAWVRLKDGACRGYRHSVARIVGFVEASNSWKISLVRKPDEKGKGKRRRSNISDTPAFNVDVPSKSLERIDPTLDEVFPFFSLKLASSSALRAAIPFKSGDPVKVVSGEQAGMIGRISVVTNSIAQVMAPGLDETSGLEAPLSSIEPHFTPGDHVEVLMGTLKGTTGWVTKSSDGIVTIQVSPEREEQSLLPLVYFKPVDIKLGAAPSLEHPPANVRDPKLGREVLIIDHHQFKGRFGYVKAVGNDIYVVWLESDHKQHHFESKYLVDLQTGRAFDGHHLGPNWTEYFDQLVHQRLVAHERAPTPPPSESVETEADIDGSSAWTVTHEDRLALRNREESWLLDPDITKHFPTLAIVVSLGASNTASTSMGTWARTVSPVQVKTPPQGGEVTLTWKDKRSRVIQENVVAHSVMPTIPQKQRKAVIFKGPSKGTIVTYVAPDRGMSSEGKLAKVYEEDPKTVRKVLLDSLCRVEEHILS
jgi:ribosomal protein L24